MCLTPLDMLLSANKQWGKSTSTGEYVTHTFPIKFTVIPIVVAGALTSNTSGNTGSQSNPCYRSITVSNFVFCMYDNARGYAGSTYIAIGYQLQWGFTLFEPVDYKNINFTLPLAVNGTFCAFSTGYDAKGSTFLWHSMSHFNNINVGVTGFVFDSRYTFTGLGYLAICWQKQWGFTGRNIKTWVYPIQFNNVFGVVGTWNRSSGAIYESITIDKITNISCGIDGAWSGGSSVKYECLTIAIGLQQQWGANLHGWVIFPIPFSQFRRLVTNHQGIVFMDSKAVESHSLSGFTLDVRNNNDSSEDAQWIAIGC